MRLVNGHTHARMNHHWTRNLEPCKCGGTEMVLFRLELGDSMFIRCGKCRITGTSASNYEDAIKNFKMVQLIS